MANSYIKNLDPVQGLVEYVQDVKPYHTKIIEVLIEYVFNDNVGVTMIENQNYLDMQTDGGWDSYAWDAQGWDDNMGTVIQSQ